MSGTRLGEDAGRRHASAAVTAGQETAWDGTHDRVRVVVRPVASPSAIGMFGLAVGTFVLAGLQLGWVPEQQSAQVGLVLLGFAFGSQLLAAVVAIVARDIVVATAMCVLALTWLVSGLVLRTSVPGSTSKALGLLLVVSCVCLALIAVTTAASKLVPALVFLVAAVRFGLTAVYQLSAFAAWKTASGMTGIVLSVLALYTGWAFLVEGALKKTVFPLGRRGAGLVAVDGSLDEQTRGSAVEPGVRMQL